MSADLNTIFENIRTLQNVDPDPGLVSPLHAELLRFRIHTAHLLQTEITTPDEQVNAAARVGNLISVGHIAHIMIGSRYKHFSQHIESLQFYSDNLYFFREIAKTEGLFYNPRGTRGKTLDRFLSDLEQIVLREFSRIVPRQDDESPERYVERVSITLTRQELDYIVSSPDNINHSLNLLPPIAK
ncbi:MAG: hypothetical protein QY312_00515 [Candidatus Dojkabacteria bacterium]|nr:MAG: hypothetical protein QY312_00515 [Candidatus Dojkabacteria bacterium]